MRSTNPIFGRYVFSPGKLMKTIESYINSFKAYNTGAISVGTMGSDLNADYNRKNVIDRNTAEQIVMDGLAHMRNENYQVMVDGGKRLYAGLCHRYPEHAADLQQPQY